MFAVCFPIGSLGWSHKDQGVQPIFCGSRHSGQMCRGEEVEQDLLKACRSSIACSSTVQPNEP